MKIRKWVDKVVRAIAPEVKIDGRSLRYLLQKQATLSSAAFIAEQMKYEEAFQTREGLYRYAMDRVPEKGLLVEFGVAGGSTINTLAAMTKRTICGFDSFEGFPDDGLIPKYSDGGVKWYSGKINRGGELPSVRANVTLVKGWFDQTLPAFLIQHDGPFALLHIDSDIYSSARCILDLAGDRLVAGSIIIFDEYMNFEGWQRHEHRAFTEFVSKTSIRYEWIGYTYGQTAAVRITGH